VINLPLGNVLLYTQHAQGNKCCCYFDILLHLIEDVNFVLLYCMLIDNSHRTKE